MASPKSPFPEFGLERYFAEYEFKTPYLLCCSDTEAWSVSDLLKLATADERKRWEDLTLQYTESTGLTDLRYEIAKLYLNITVDDVLVLTPQEGILIAMHCLLSPGDLVVAQYPAYQSLYENANSPLKCKVKFWRPQEVDGKWHFDVPWLREFVSQNKPKLVVVNFPHNPTGAYPTAEEWAEIIDICKSNDVYLFSDEMYRCLEDDEIRNQSAVEVYDKAVSLCGMSKSFGMPGVRLGWLVTKDKAALESFQSFKDYTTICSSAPSEVLAWVALRHKEDVVARQKKICDKNLLMLREFFERDFVRERLEWREPVAGPICFPKVVGMPADGFCKALVEKKGVLLLPSSTYSSGNEHVRFGFGRANMLESLAKLAEFLKETPKAER